MHKTTLLDEPNTFAIGYWGFAQDLGQILKLPYLTLLICNQGRAVFEINFKKYIVKKNDIIVLYDDSIAIPKAVSKAFFCSYIQLEKNLAAEVAYQLPNHLFAFLQHTPVCKPKKIDHNAMKHWQSQTFFMLENAAESASILLRNQLQNFFLTLTARLPEETQVAKSSYSRQQMLAWRFWEMVGEHCKQHREVAFYAKQLSITPFYLSQITKNCFNDAPKTLIDRQVILEIKALLTNKQLSIKRIADQLSFDDPAYMCRYFKRHTGTTLTAAR